MDDREHLERGFRGAACPARSCSGVDVGLVVTVADVRRMPVPVVENWEWQLRGACRAFDSSMFFHPERERGAQKARRDAAAKQICGRCPVIEQCRRHALATHEPYGIWGGLTAAERDAYLRKTAAHCGSALDQDGRRQLDDGDTRWATSTR